MPLSTVLGAQSLVQPGVCTTATRPASPYTGQAIYDTTLSQTLTYNGTAWVSTGGLVFLAGASFSAAASASLPANTFSATYTNYKLVVHVSATDTTREMWVRLRSSGADDSTANYYNANTSSTAAAVTVNSGGTGQTKFATGLYGVASPGNELAYTLDILRPQVLSHTHMTGTGVGLPSSVAILIGSALNCYQVSTTQFDSLTILPSAGTFTGSYKVYGYANS